MDMMYKTVECYAQDEFVEKKSRFIGCIMPCKTEQEAIIFIEQKKKEYWDATHNVYAYIIRQNNACPIKRSSDDKEPQGTAGYPVLEVLEREGIVDVCVVATRYFGGVMLGAGGLVRAYSHTSKIALDSAKILTMSLCHQLRLEFDYTLYGKISYIMPNYNIQTVWSDFSDKVTLEIVIRYDRLEKFQSQLTEITNGRVKIEKVLVKYMNMV